MLSDLTHIVKNVCDLARSAGEFIRKESIDFDISRAETKGLHDFVSYVDIETEKILTGELIKILPESGFLTEEGTIVDPNKRQRWIIDPLDGTTNFLHGLAPYSISIALEEDNEIVLGVVYIVSSDELFYATKEGGAWLNGNRIFASQAQRVSDSLIATGFPIKNFTRLEPYLKCLEHLIRSSHGVRRMGSAAVDLAYVACGRFDAFYEYNLNYWDIAAGMLLVREAGGRVSDFKGNEKEVLGRETLASNSFIYNEFRKIVGRFMG